MSSELAQIKTYLQVRSFREPPNRASNEFSWSEALTELQPSSAAPVVARLLILTVIADCWFLSYFRDGERGMETG